MKIHYNCIFILYRSHAIALNYEKLGKYEEAQEYEKRNYDFLALVLGVLEPEKLRESEKLLKEYALKIRKK
jgi:hypothetical protein